MCQTTKSDIPAAAGGIEKVTEDNHNSVTFSPGQTIGLRLRAVAFWSLIPAVAVVPAWFFLGRALIGGTFGWVGVFLLPLAVVLLVAHVVLCCVVFSRKAYQNHVDHRTTVSLRMARTICVYYVFHVLFQVFVLDAGDTPSEGSVAHKYLGVNEDIATGLAMWFLLPALFVLLVVLLVLACYEQKKDGECHELPI